MKNLKSVDGYEVLVREKATGADTDDSVIGRDPNSVLRTVDKLLLSNDAVLFQCMHPLAEDCTYTNSVVKSVLSHQKMHSPLQAAKAAQVRLAEIEAKQAEQFKNRSNGAKKAAVTRRERSDESSKTVATPSVNMPVEVGRPAVRDGRGRGNGEQAALGDRELAKMAQNVITAWNALREAEDTYQNVMIGYMRAAQVATETPKVDPTIAAKAKKWDAYLEFQKLISNE
jgi:hypothetical protein